MREHWRELGFWRWWWRNRVPLAVKSLLALAALGALVAGGWYAAQKLPSAQASDSGGQTVLRTVERVVTVQGHAKVVVKRVPVIRKVYVANSAGKAKTVTLTRPQTVVATRTVVRTVATAPPRAQTVTTPGRTRTVTSTRTITDTKTVTTLRWRVITVVEKQKPVTVTVTVAAP
jgi:predicted membrane metal-binding protein